MNSNQNNASASSELNHAKKNMTDEERIKLASKLDKELEEYIEGLAKKSEGWKEDDEWNKNMDNHPCFINKVPEDGEVSPLVEGLQQLKYSTEENTPEELANSYKDDGNYNFKYKNYRMAVIGFTEGLSQKFSNPELRAQLFNNRSATHWQLKNYRSCYNDCKEALKYQPVYVKAQKRLAQVSFELGLYDECVGVCDVLLSGASDEMISSLRVKALKQKKNNHKNILNDKIEQLKEKAKNIKLRKMIEERNIKFLYQPCWKENNISVVNNVHIEGDNLVWPVVILYPEHKISDIIESFHELTTFQEQFDIVFAEYPEWDVDKKYTPKSVIIHYEDMNGRIHNVKKDSTLDSVLQEPNFRVDGLTPSFIVHSKDTEAYKRFLNQYS